MPSQEDYQKALKSIKTRTSKLIHDSAAHYIDSADQKTQKSLKEWLTIPKEELELQREFVKRFEKALPA